jgi:imidazole glycerol-phosphate synthase subunit HisH
MPRIALINYGLGNLKSITKAFEVFGAILVLTDDPDVIMSCDSIVLPGVGAFKEGMSKLDSLGLTNTIIDFADTGKPILGICLGMQLLFDSSNEFGLAKGLGLISGFVHKISSETTAIKKLPHISWNALVDDGNSAWDQTILDGLENATDMYFVHSYCAEPLDPSYVLSKTYYSGVSFCSTVKKNNIYGCQYHPEKSAKYGLKIIDNFIKLSKDNNYEQ